MANSIFENINKLMGLYETLYQGSFWVAEYKFGMKIIKLKQALPIWQTEILQSFKN